VSAAARTERLSAWRPPPGTIGMVALGQAGVAVRSGDDLVLIDLFASARRERLLEPVVDPRALRGVTAVLATHEHGDHLDLPAWQQLAQACPGARFVVAEPLVPMVTEAGIPTKRVVGVRVGRPFGLGSATVTAVPARHGVDVVDGYSLGDPLTPHWLGYVVELGGVRLYHAGDTLAHPRITRAVDALRPDIALLPINGRSAEREQRNVVGNMSPDQAARMARDLSVALAIPIHFDTIRGNTGRPDAFVRAMRRHHPAASVWVPGFGAAMVWPVGAASWHERDA
jgi:L-ascorbate metabolism protein UlaG (beta-lactamase superfamily)